MRAALVCYRPVSGAFHPPPGVLCTFRSRYWCAIGLGTYLALEADGPQLPTPYPRYGTQGSGHHPSRLPLRGCHPLWRPIPGHFGSAGWGGTPGPSPHISMRLSLMDSVWAPPLSLAGTQGIPYWFLLLPLLGCFRSGGSRSQAKARDQRPRPKPRPLGDPIRRSPDQRLPAATRGFSQLATSFLGARAEASTGRRPQAWDLSFAVVCGFSLCARSS